MNSNDAARREALSAPIPPDRMLVPYQPSLSNGGGKTVSAANACFLASLIASSMGAETVRSRRKLAPDVAAARYRTMQALTAT